MNVIDAIRWRRSVRKFAARPLEPAVIQEILEAGRLAPSSSNQQAWQFVAVDDPNLIRAVPDQVPLATSRVISFCRSAALIVVGCYTQNLTHRIGRVFGHENHVIDVSIAMTQMTLAATALGVGSCWIGWFSEKKMKKMLAIPNRYRIAALLAFGYPADASTDEGIGGIKPRPRKAMSEIASRNRFGTPFLSV